MKSRVLATERRMRNLRHTHKNAQKLRFDLKRERERDQEGTGAHVRWCIEMRRGVVHLQKCIESRCIRATLQTPPSSVHR